MILTRMYLNMRRSGARKLLGSPQALHAAILSGFTPGVDPGRVLWRVDEDNRLSPVLYAVTASKPDFTHIEEQAGWPSQPTTRSALYGDFLARLEPGQRWAFRLTANPTHRAFIAGASRVVGHVTAAQQIAWLRERAEALGLDLGQAEEPAFTLTSRSVRRFNRKGATVTLSIARYDGLLGVVDAARLRTALTLGIGRAKAYGCGLMTLARP